MWHVLWSRLENIQNFVTSFKNYPYLLRGPVDVDGAWVGKIRLSSDSASLVTFEASHDLWCDDALTKLLWEFSFKIWTWLSWSGLLAGEASLCNEITLAVMLGVTLLASMSSCSVVLGCEASLRAELSLGFMWGGALFNVASCSDMPVWEFSVCESSQESFESRSSQSRASHLASPSSLGLGSFKMLQFSFDDSRWDVSLFFELGVESDWMGKARDWLEPGTRRPALSLVVAEEIFKGFSSWLEPPEKMILVRSTIYLQTRTIVGICR